MAEDAATATASRQSISARIAALRIDQVTRKPGDLVAPSVGNKSTRPNAPPPLPKRPTGNLRRNAASSTPIPSNGSTTRLGNEPIGYERHDAPPAIAVTANGQAHSQKTQPPLPPRLPPRAAVAKISPSSPPGRPSEHHHLREQRSIESVNSVPSTRSSVSTSSTGTALTRVSTSSTDGSSNECNGPMQGTRRLPPSYPRRPEEPAEQSIPSVPMRQASHNLTTSPNPVSLDSKKPPPLPARRVTSVEPTPSKAKRSALSFALNEPSRASETPSAKPTVPARAVTDSRIDVLPPPIPISTKPPTSSAVSTAVAASVSDEQRCLKCRDFSEPDTHATRFPRHTLPSASTEWLAHQLTSPFPSATDKARVIFTWLHYNIEYDVKSFFNHSIKRSTPSSTLSSGLAVCEGYAGLFSALATHAGLESVVVGGHGKGYGFAPVTSGAAIPAFSTGHAWNAVKIDGGEWKLIDCCWGAGAVNGKDQPYIKRFAPTFFTMDNDEFGRRHFPENPTHFFRVDGRAPPSWEEYIMADASGREGVQVFTGAEGR